MFRRKKTPKTQNTIQEVLNDAWLESENGIITNLPMRSASEHRVKVATFVWIMLRSRRFSVSLPLTTATVREAKSVRNGLSALMESFALSMIGSRATITPSQREECLSRKPDGLLAVHTAFLSVLFKESLIRIWQQVFSQRLFAWMATFGNRDWVLNPTI